MHTSLLISGGNIVWDAFGVQGIINMSRYGWHWTITVGIRDCRHTVEDGQLQRIAIITALTQSRQPIPVCNVLGMAMHMSTQLVQ